MAKASFPGALQLGAKIGKYEIRAQVAVGGMAVIYQGYDPTLNRLGAVKQIAPHLAQDPRFVERFRAEAQTLARLSSSQANIVSVYELIEQDGQLFLVMEYVEGTTLRALMDRGPIALQTGLGILLSTALGLRAMHAQGIVHRDLSPANLMIARDGALKIADFGLIGHSGGKTSLPMGTTKYMAPEMFAGGTVDPRADLYSLGLIAYEMFAGREKFDATFADVLRDEKAQQVRWMHWHSNPSLTAPPLKDLQPGIPPLVSKIVERMMEKDPARRFASADQIIRWLRRIFVMHVQGKSVSVTESENLEKEMDADTGSTAASAAAAPAAAAPSRPGAAPSAPDAPAAAPASTAEKTAPIPVPKWTWQRATFWASVLGGPLVILAAVLLIWDHHKTNDAIHARRDRERVAESLFKDDKFKEAAEAYAAIAADYRNVPAVAVPALQNEWLSRAEAALAADDLEAARAALGKSETQGLDTRRADEFRKKLEKKEALKQGFAEVDRFLAAGDFDSAIQLLTSLQQAYDLDTSTRIEEIMNRKTLKEYTDLVKRADNYMASSSFQEAETLYRRAQEIQDTAEVRDRLETIKKRVAYATCFGRAEKAAAAAKWTEAIKDYEAALEIQPSPELEAKLKGAKVQALLVKAAAFEKGNLRKEAIAAYAEVLGIDPQQPVALAKVKLAGAQEKRDTFIRQGDDSMAKKAYKEAVTSYQSALPLIDAADAPLKARVEAQIKEAKYQDALATGRAAEARGNWDAAHDAYVAAQDVLDTTEIKNALTQLETARQYAKHLTIGKELLAQFRYVPALKEFDLARGVRDTEEVRELTRETNYQRYLVQAKGLIRDLKYSQAKAVLGVARNYANEAQKIEVDALVAACEKALEGGGK